MARRRKTGKKPAKTNTKRKHRLHMFLPKAGFDFSDKRARAMMSGDGACVIKDSILALKGELTKPVVEQVLSSIFEVAIDIMKQDPSKIAEMTPGDFWGIVRDSLRWANFLRNQVVASLVIGLLIAQETYEKTRPYNQYQHQYGKFAEIVHKFSGMLKEHHEDNALLMQTYFNSLIALSSDEEGEEEGEEGEEEDEDEDAGDMEPEAETRAGKKRKLEEEEEVEQQVEEATKVLKKVKLEDMDHEMDYKPKEIAQEEMDGGEKGGNEMDID